MDQGNYDFPSRTSAMVTKEIPVEALNTHTKYTHGAPAPFSYVKWPRASTLDILARFID